MVTSTSNNTAMRSKVGHGMVSAELKQNMNIEMNPNVGYRTVPEATISDKEPNQTYESTEKSNDDMYDYVIP